MHNQGGTGLNEQQVGSWRLFLLLDTQVVSTHHNFFLLASSWLGCVGKLWIWGVQRDAQSNFIIIMA